MIESKSQTRIFSVSSEASCAAVFFFPPSSLFFFFFFQPFPPLRGRLRPVRPPPAKGSSIPAAAITSRTMAIVASSSVNPDCLCFLLMRFKTICANQCQSVSIEILYFFDRINGIYRIKVLANILLIL
jgi:hypothetical protein